MERTVNRRVKLGVVIGSRAFFGPAPCKQARDEVLARCAALDIETVTLPFEATPNGAVQSVEELMPSACEVDVMGALSIYALTLASGAPAAILDWNNNYGEAVYRYLGWPIYHHGGTPEPQLAIPNRF